MKIRLVNKEEYSFIEDFVYEIFKNTNYSDGVAEKSLVREIRKKHYYISQLDLVVDVEKFCPELHSIEERTCEYRIL